MEMPDLRRLDDGDVEAFRLGAQVLGHKADLDNHPAVGAYFRRLEHALKAEVARRAARSTATEGESPPLLEVGAPAQPDDRRVVAEYLGLLIANERLSEGLREFCRKLRDRDSR